MRDRITAIRNHAKKIQELLKIEPGSDFKELTKQRQAFDELFKEFPQILFDIADELEAARPAINREA